jgi:hypothetical protein
MNNDLFLKAQFKLDYSKCVFDPFIAHVHTSSINNNERVLLISLVRYVHTKPVYDSIYYPFIYKGVPVIVR